MAVEISICMITYNKAPFLRRSVPAILERVERPDAVEFLLLDNGSTDDTRAVIKDLLKRYPISVFRTRENVGLNGYSILTENAKGHLIITADDDIFYLHPANWHKYFIRALNSTFSGKRFGYVGSDTINADGGRMDTVYGHAVIDGMSIEIGPVGGWFAATKRNILQEVGGFHSGMPKMYLEDADYQNRVWEHGYLCGTLKNVNVYHARAPRHYKELGCSDTYLEKVALARDVGIELEPLG